MDQVYLHYGKPDQQALPTLTAQQVASYHDAGHFAPGSMGPKMEAARRFVQSGPGRQAIITSLERAADALAGKAGTVVSA